MKDTPYVAGLLHDIGSLSLMNLYPEAYRDLLDCAVGTGSDLRLMEVERFGVDHCTAGRWIAESWKLGNEVAEAAQHHHDPFHTEAVVTLEIVKAAIKLSDALGWSAVAQTPLEPAQAVAILPNHFRQNIQMQPEELFVWISERIEAAGEPNAASKGKVR